MKLHIINIVFVIMGVAVSCSGQAVPGSPQSDNVSVTERVIPKFSADSAMIYLREQVDFGPRVPGSTAHERCADMLVLRLKDMGAEVLDAPHVVRHPVTGNALTVRNIFAQFNPDAQKRILLLAHYDTRPWADEDADANNRSKPIDGANDGASGVAVALEVARHNSALPGDIGLDILFTDYEDSGSTGNDESWCIGARDWALNMPYTNANLPRFGILLDMVGGKNAVFSREYFSQNYAGNVTQKVWDAAAALGYSNIFVDRVGGAINDDHVPLLQAGIPVVDIIETTPQGFNQTWHTLQDNIENISPQTIKAVGEVVTKVIYSER